MWQTKMTRKGQVTIPKEIREELGVKPGDTLLITREKDRIVMGERKGRLMELAGLWKEMTEEQRREIKYVWKGWHERILHRHGHSH